MGHRQKGKGKKRRKSWHRGKGEARQWASVIRQSRARTTRDSSDQGAR